MVVLDVMAIDDHMHVDMCVHVTLYAIVHAMDPHNNLNCVLTSW